jgi:hypothetical protein
MSTITVGQSEPIPGFAYGATSVTLRIYLRENFITSSGVTLQAGRVDTNGWYLSITCTVEGETVTIPSFQIASTTDGLDTRYARYTAWFYSGKRKLGVYQGFEDFKIGHSALMVSWSDIRLYNVNVSTPNDQSGFYTKDQALALFQLRSSAFISALTGDVTAGVDGVSAIGIGKVTNAMLAGSISDSKLSTIATAGKVSDSALSANIPLKDAAANAFTGVLTSAFGGANPLLPPNLVGAQTVKLGSSAIINDSGSGDYRQISGHVINSGTRNVVAGSFGARADGACNAWGINPWGYANASGATGIAIENNFAVLASGGQAFGELFVVVGSFNSNAFFRLQSGASGINATNGIEVNRGAIGFEPISGSFLTFLGSPTMQIGCDFSGAIFSTAPFLLGANQFAKAKNSLAASKIIGGIDGFDFVLFQSGGAGMRIINSANTAEIFQITDAGYQVLTQITAPGGTPAAGTTWLYLDAADGKTKLKNALGVVTPLN